MRLAIGSDHAGFIYKGVLIELLHELGHEVQDFGTFSEESVDYPDFIRPVAIAVARGEYERGIVLGGIGQRRSDRGEQGARHSLRAVLGRDDRATGARA